jgi:hypothetical protein
MTEQTHELARLFKTPPRPSTVRFAEAYLVMAKAKYRPAAPGDGLGSINLSEEELEDDDLLRAEAVEYATRMEAEHDSRTFRIGCANYRTGRAFIFAIEAARLLTDGEDGAAMSLRMLKMAIKDIQNSKRAAKSASREQERKGISDAA